LEAKIKLKFENTKFKKFRDSFFSNKYQVTVLALALIVLFLLYSVLTQLVKQKDNTFTTDSGNVVDITIDDIKKDIYLFTSMDPTSNDKGIKYNEILQKLNILESK
jgi:hypothetical protein